MPIASNPPTSSEVIPKLESLGEFDNGEAFVAEAPINSHVINLTQSSCQALGGDP